MINTTSGAAKDASQFIEENIELIEENNWTQFFWNMLSNPNDWIVSHPATYYIMDYLKKAQITWDEKARQDVFIEAMQNVCRNFQDMNTDITSHLEMKLYDLYYIDEGLVMPREDQCNWLGYSKGQFICLIQDLKKVIGCQIISSNPLSRPFNDIMVEIF